VNWRVRCETGGQDSAPAAAATAAAGRAQAPAPSVDPVESAQREEEESMLAEAGSSEPSTRRDPEEAALELLQNELGARRIDIENG
jgi:DNA polymerase III subunit gamma/tau